MRLIFYGTLKRGYGNNRLLCTSDFIGPRVVHGYKLYNAGFPVAFPSENESICGEEWDIGTNRSVLYSLDRLEGEGFMYHRREVEPDLFMYVGDKNFWSDLIDRRIEHCPKNTDGHYEWSR